MTARPPGFCRACGLNRVAWTEPRVDYCYACLPGGPFPAPGCGACRSPRYFCQGLCERCHPGSPQYPDSCRDCLAYGVRREHNWRYWGCRGWQSRYPRGTCPYCGRTVPIGDAGACRLCWQQAMHVKEPGVAADPASANRYGQQLFLANLHQARNHTGRRNHRTRTAPPASPARQAVPVRAATFAAVPHRQYPLFHLRPNLLAIRLADTTPDLDPAMRAFCEQVLREHATQHGWSVKQTNDVGRCLRILQALQDTPGARILASELEALAEAGLSVQSTLEVLAAADLLDDDRVSGGRDYFDRQVADLPAAMREQLETWFTIMSHGSTRPPRRRPRHPDTIRLHLRGMRPALAAWIAEGHDSLAEITRDDIRDVLPTGATRITVGQALRSLFGILKAHKRVFVNPTIGVPIGKVGKTVPLPADIDTVRQALHAPDPAAALAVALAIFHALTARQIRDLQRTDIVDGRLALGTRSIPLAGPVRDRLAGYLDDRDRRWPHTINPHLFVNRRSAPRLNPVGPNFPWLAAGVRPQALREDCILAEIEATGGDERRICDLFGLSVAGAGRYRAALTDPDLTDAAGVGSRTHAST